MFDVSVTFVDDVSVSVADAASLLLFCFVDDPFIDF